jgi:hypothetical protein
MANLTVLLVIHSMVTFVHENLNKGQFSTWSAGNRFTGDGDRGFD